MQPLDDVVVITECEAGWKGTVGRQSLLAWVVAWRYPLFATDNDRKQSQVRIRVGDSNRKCIMFLNLMKK
jgi:hypothetical protein